MHRDQTHLRDIGLNYAQVNLLARNIPSKATKEAELKTHILCHFSFLFSEIKDTYNEELNHYWIEKGLTAEFSRSKERKRIA